MKKINKIERRSLNLLRFMGFSSKIIRLLSIIAVITLLFGLFLSFSAPEDYRQGVLVKIMFLHVPFSWLSLLCYIMMTVCAIRILCSQCFFSGIALRSAAPIGSVFTVLALITGSLWGRPVWGTWWEWDARLTSMLIFLLIYLSIVSLSRAFENSRISTQATAILTIIGSGCISFTLGKSSYFFVSFNPLNVYDASFYYAFYSFSAYVHA
jgi:heme exporter protein C